MRKIMFLASVVCWIACSDTEDEDKETMCPDSEDINKIEIVKESCQLQILLSSLLYCLYWNGIE